MSATPIRIEKMGHIALVIVDNPPVNALSHAVRSGLMDAVTEIAEDADTDGAVLACEGRTFISGADIREFGKPIAEPILPDVIDSIEASEKPWAAAIHGAALGGGFEVALGCHYRVMADAAEVGLPEVKLGLIPGAGGTQRLPRLIGIERAMDAICNGKRLSASVARDLGIADSVVTARDLRVAAVSFLVKKIVEGGSHPAASMRTVPPIAEDTLDAAMAAVKRRARGQESSVRAAESVANAGRLPFREGLTEERRIFLELVQSDQSAALRHVFFGERIVAKPPYLAETAARPVRSIGIVGAGTMGSGIAITFADAGYQVVVVEASEHALQAGHARIAGYYQGLAKRGRISFDDAAASIASIEFATEFDSFHASDLIVEAVFESMDIKKEVFGELDRIAKPGAILATNTSYLDVNEIASVTSRPADVLGMHFFAPANVMRLLEVVRGDKTALDALATALAVARKLNKVGVVAGVCDGFIGNRIWASLRRQYEFLVEDGAWPHEVDKAMTDYGFAMGPFAVYDLSGLDVAWHRRKTLAKTRDPRERTVDIADLLCEERRFGRKSKAGWYRYEDERTPIPDPLVHEIIASERARKGIVAIPMRPGDIQHRARAAIVNESCRILDEGIAQSPLDIDMVLVNGYGYPAWRGGPMFDADRVGLDVILQDVEAMCDASGYGWEPASLLQSLVKDGKSFSDLDA